MIHITEVFGLYKGSQVDEFLLKYTGLSLNEKGLKLKDVQSNWHFLGENSSNGSSISILKKGEKGLVERITNAIDAVIEKQKDAYGMGFPANSEIIIKKAFPKYYSNLQRIYEKHSEVKSQAYDIENQVILAVNDGSKANKPTFDILDKGTGVTGSDFKNTLLSINKGNKLSSDKKYLIGAFGQGGSTSLPFADSTIIVSKYDGKYYFTIVKSVELTDYKNHVYMYLTIENQIPELIVDNVSFDDYLQEFISSESGTLIRMIETDISREYRNNDISKPRMLVDYINTELFSVGIPVKIIENRGNYRDNKNAQNRNAYGTLTKLKTSKKYVKDDYSGSVEIYHNENPYKIDYYMILPDNENEWGSDLKCKNVFEQFNVYGDPILYTVNGQTITSETYTKLKNNGLTFLKYRLLIVINLDYLGNEKYKFFTSDRAQIKDTDLTKGFIDKVVKRITEIDKLQEMNEIIAEKSISSGIDSNLLNEISSEVQDIYNKFLKNGNIIPGRKKTNKHFKLSDDEFLDHIGTVEITSTQRDFYSDESVSFVVTTNAAKYVNETAMISPFIDGKAFHEYSPNFMNGRISYRMNDKTLKKGDHLIQFIYFDDTGITIESTKILFTILNEKAPENIEKIKDKKLDLNIILRDEAELICDIAKNKETKKIDAYVCLESDELVSQVYGYNASTDEISETKNKIIKPIVLFALFLDEIYDNVQNIEEKNKIMTSFIKSTLLN
ncbi:MAG: ATP-binding protein [Candidatus Delongbacteria bacterium]|nr:ATP-binding protein [Candidatus Delongbacteria bacterium]